jgi:hypothetical protein
MWTSSFPDGSAWGQPWALLSSHLLMVSLVVSRSLSYNVTVGGAFPCWLEAPAIVCV